MEGTLSLAFSSPGAVSTSVLRNTRRQLHAISAVPVAGKRHTEVHAACTLSCVEAGAMEDGFACV